MMALPQMYLPRPMMSVSDSDITFYSTSTSTIRQGGNTELNSQPYENSHEKIGYFPFLMNMPEDTTKESIVKSVTTNEATVGSIIPQETPTVIRLDLLTTMGEYFLNFNLKLTLKTCNYYMKETGLNNRYHRNDDMKTKIINYYHVTSDSLSQCFHNLRFKLGFITFSRFHLVAASFKDLNDRNGTYPSVELPVFTACDDDYKKITRGQMLTYGLESIRDKDHVTIDPISLLSPFLIELLSKPGCYVKLSPIENLNMVEGSNVNIFISIFP